MLSDLKRLIAFLAEDFDTICSLRLVSSSWREALGDPHFEEMVAEQFTFQKFLTNQFWVKAKKRDRIISKPLGSYHQEIVRLKWFLDWNQKVLGSQLTMHDFEFMWNCMELK